MHVEGQHLFLFGGAAAVVAEGRRRHCRGSRGRQLGAKPRHDMIIGIVPTMRLACGRRPDLWSNAAKNPSLVRLM
jgi:hypothetical protein